MFDKNVLITNIGRRGYLVKFLKEIPNFIGKVYVSDCDDTVSGLYGCNDGHFILSKPVDNPQFYIETLISLCNKNNVGIIIPVIDPEIYILSKYIDEFKANNIFVAVSSERVLEICYNKFKMNNFLVENGLSIPISYFSLAEFENDYINKNIEFPVILKPIYGSGSISTYKLSNIDELRSLWEDGMMIQEFIDGLEFGIDTFNNLDGNPIRCIVKKKISMRSGETDKALIVKNEKIQKTIISLAQKLGHICNLDCDILVKNETIYIIDLNPRFGGGYPATHMSGVNYLELVLRIVNGEIINPDFLTYNDDILVMKEISLVTKRM